MKKVALALVGLVVGAVVMSTVVEVGRAEPRSGAVDAQIERNAKAIEANRVLIAQAEADAGVGSAPASAETHSVTLPAPDAGSGSGSGSSIAAPSTTPAPATEPQLADVSLIVKLWKGGQFFLFGIMALYLGLFVWAKVDKKRAFYATAALGAVGLLVAAIRAGDTPTAGQAINVAGGLLAILIKGPEKA